MTLQNIKTNRRLLIIAAAVAVLVVATGAYFLVGTGGGKQSFTLSGTIEATQTQLSAQIGGQVRQVNVAEGDQVSAGQTLLSVYSPSTNASQTIKSPIDGVVLERLVEPDETTAPGSTLVVVADLNTLTLKIYVPEDRYGAISMGEVVPVTVDSFPGQAFSGKVSHIADQAEFTPRNVQTVDGRKSTVFAITLDLAPSGGKLKPGMPADVTFLAQ